MWRHHSSARQPFDAIWVTACSTIAAGSGMMAIKIPIRIMPPAMPKMPDRNEVATIVRLRASDEQRRHCQAAPAIQARARIVR